MKLNEGSQPSVGQSLSHSVSQSSVGVQSSQKKYKNNKRPKKPEIKNRIQLRPTVKTVEKFAVLFSTTRR